MQGVDYPVLGISDTGHTQMMQPGQDYKFDGKKVTEFPMMQKGGWLDKYAHQSDATRNIEFENSVKNTIAQYNRAMDPDNQPHFTQWNPKPGEREALAAKEAERLKDYNSWDSRFSRNPHVMKGTKNLAEAGEFALDVMTAGEGALALRGLAKPAIKAIAKEVATKAGIKSATKASTSNYIKDVYNATKSYLTEKSGEKLAGSENRAAIAEGNKWSQDWVNNPATEKKLRRQIIDQKTLGKNNPEIFDRINTPETMEDYRSLTNYKPAATEYPLSDQKKDLINIIKDNKNNVYGDMIHGDNYGVSYKHSRNPLWDTDIYIPGSRSSGPGTWISRTPRMDQAARKSVTIHENAHDWLRDGALERLGYKDEIQSHLTQDAMDNYYKFALDRDAKKNYLGYLADPTEVHARIMETRHHFGLTPTDKVTPEMAEGMLQVIKQGKIPTVNKKFADIFSSPKGVSALFNNLPAMTPVAVGVGAAATALPKEQKNGGWLNKYK
jgi:hypothetical protein